MSSAESNSGATCATNSAIDSADTSRQSLPYGLFLLVVGAVFFFGGANLTASGLTNERDIGPRVAPMAIGSLIVLGGIALTATSLVQHRRRRTRDANVPHSEPVPESADSTDDATLAKSEQGYHAWLVLGGLVLCTALMPRLGFVAPAFALTVGILVLLRAQWWEAVASAVLILFVVHVLFVRIFQVVLPRGPFGF